MGCRDVLLGPHEQSIGGIGGIGGIGIRPDAPYGPYARPPSRDDAIAVPALLMTARARAARRHACRWLRPDAPRVGRKMGSRHVLAGPHVSPAQSSGALGS
jgi:hypothetical protein